MLGLQSESIARRWPLVPTSVAVEDIARIELQAGLRRVDTELTAARGVPRPGRQDEGGRACLVEDPVQVVTLADLQLFVVLGANRETAVDVVTDRVGFVKSNGVPVTGWILPVGMRAESTGVKLSALMYRI